jgi:hypothetical protein
MQPIHITKTLIGPLHKECHISNLIPFLFVHAFSFLSVTYIGPCSRPSHFNQHAPGASPHNPSNLQITAWHPLFGWAFMARRQTRWTVSYLLPPRNLLQSQLFAFSQYRISDYDRPASEIMDYQGSDKCFQHTIQSARTTRQVTLYSILKKFHHLHVP